MPSEVEDWARQVIAATEKGNHFEDGLVELKSAWPDSAFEAARQLAAQANAVAGNPLLWLIGVKQSVGVVGVAPRHLATWWPQVRSNFDKVWPHLLADRILDFPGGKVVALMFDPSDPPYVILYPQGESPTKRAIRKEVPWREGTTVRSADREDLLRLLEPVVMVPVIKAIPGRLNTLIATKKPGGGEEKLVWTLDLRVFVTPKSTRPVVFTASQLPLAKVHLEERDIILRLEPWSHDEEGGLAESAHRDRSWAPFDFSAARDV